MSTEELVVEARARIIWGDAPASVRDLLPSNGMSAGDANRMIQEFITERTWEIRKAGGRDAFIGTAIVCLCASFIYIPASTFLAGRQR
jgi:ABC-type phosphate transport system permease subunit